MDKNLIEESIASNALLFGDYTLKSGRKSPYFFNAGKLYSGRALAMLAEAFTEKLISMNIKFDIIFGPAYKAIPLAAITAQKYFEKTGKDVDFAYNRKEVKDHGEGGVLAGAPLSKRIVIIDDVLSAGTAIREVVHIIQANNGYLAGIVLLLNRMERISQDVKKGVLDVLKDQLQVPVEAILNLNSIIEYSSTISADQAKNIEKYREKYGI